MLTRDVTYKVFRKLRVMQSLFASRNHHQHHDHKMVSYSVYTLKWGLAGSISPTVFLLQEIKVHNFVKPNDECCQKSIRHVSVYGKSPACYRFAADLSFMLGICYGLAAGKLV